VKDGLDLVDTGDPFDTIKPVYVPPAEGGSLLARSAPADDPFRAQAISDARDLWGRSHPGTRGVVGAYLGSCGIKLDAIPANLRFLLDHPYMKKVGGLYQELHRGPCVLAGIFSEAGKLIGVNQIWVDTSPPHGRAVVRMGDAEMPSEVVRGSSKGGFLPLIWPDDADALIVARSLEGALRAHAAQPRGLEGAAYWAGVDLKVMAGKMQRQKGRRYSGLPDLSDGSAFVPPHWVRRLIFLQESDAPGVREKMECGLRRALHFRPRLAASIVKVGASQRAGRS